MMFLGAVGTLSRRSLLGLMGFYTNLGGMLRAADATPRLVSAVIFVVPESLALVAP